jgi:MSHA pilin protein MshC
MDPRRPLSSHGFTLGELVMVIVIMGILAAVAMPRLMSSTAFASRGFYDEAQAVVRYAQKTAIAWRRTIVVCIAANEVRAISNTDCNAPVTLAHPMGGSAILRSQAPDGVTLSPVGSFSFDGMGRPSAAVTITVTSTISGDPARQILVAAETGYVSRN